MYPIGKTCFAPFSFGYKISMGLLLEKISVGLLIILLGYLDYVLNIIRRFGSF